MSDKDIKDKTEAPTLEDVFDDTRITETEEEDFVRKPFRKRRKLVQNLKCPLCQSGEKDISYKDVYQLKKYTSVKGKIISTDKSGVCHKHQKQLKRAIKRARYMALLPYTLKE